MDIGSTPDKKYSENFQSGPLSFEIIYKNNKIICNSGYFQDHNHKLNKISKSTAAHSTLILNNRSACSFKKNNYGQSILENGFKVFDKKVVFEKTIRPIRTNDIGCMSSSRVHAWHCVRV